MAVGIGGSSGFEPAWVLKNPDLEPQATIVKKGAQGVQGG